MDVDPSAPESPLKDKADALHSLVSGPLAADAAKASRCSRGIPAGEDFHFFFNFDEFKNPVKVIKEKAESSLRSLAVSDSLWGSKKPAQWPEDLDDAYEWLVNINDELLDRLAISMDEFKSLREKEEESGRKAETMDLEGGFQLVYGKKKKKKGDVCDAGRDEGFTGMISSTAVNVAVKDKRTTAARSKVPFHIPTIPRPQHEYNILVNNNNQPFQHVWLETSADGSRFIHPLEKIDVLDFVDKKCDEGDPIQPLPLEKTPFKLVEGVNDLKMVAAKLRGVDEFAIDLEHNQYRSFQGLTCLMQISTRTEDFVIDTLKLRIHVGPHLREAFKDPSKRKIMHGADRDIIWLQRDFGIYVCNLFDTGQASRVLQLERNSLEYLLNHFCGVAANKEYQNAEWRLRPIPDEMLKYAREDTHYLFYIYDQMKRMLLARSSDGNDLLLQVYKRSSEICMQLYEKELFTDTSYLNIYGLSDADFNSKQLAVASGLFQWRDNIARTEDEGTGYILPNKTLLEIARQIPLTSGKLRRLVKSKHPFVERHLNSVLAIIRNSIAISTAFEGIAEKLKEKQLEAIVEEKYCSSESIPANDDPMEYAKAEHDDNARGLATVTSVETVRTLAHVPDGSGDCLKLLHTGITRSTNSSSTKTEQENIFMPMTGIVCPIVQPDTIERTEKETMDSISTENLQPRKGGIASIQLQKKSACAFGALFTNSSSRRKVALDKLGLTDQDKYVNKVEQITSTIKLPFYNFSGGAKPSEVHVKETNCPVAETLQQHHADLTKLEEVIQLNTESDDEQSPSGSPITDDGMNDAERSNHPEISNGGDLQQKPNTIDEPMSPYDLTSSFKKCFKSITERNQSQKKPSEESVINLNLSSFDYAAARQNIKFGEGGEEEAKTEDGITTSSDSKQMHGDSVFGKAQGEERSRGPLQPRRRQAFPPSGNRSSTYH
ncbi:protein RRP6-like 2 isoform X1 [Canna indica]|uniref:Protein RRP6-like 2 isoform X1 n=1 Tax=Canna indica TaxID=4628 RepID=A0AAQ3JL17_9LILI|nr:protein RRP6-like 2 isoform X1 [Canna indica]